MKQGWEYKKLDTCCEVEYGTRVVQKKDGGTIYPVYGGGGETFRMDRYNREDSIVVSRFAMSKTCVRFVQGKFFLNDSGLSVKAGEGLLQEYLNHHLFFLNDSIYNLGKGAAQKNLEVKSFKQLLIAVPPLSQQQAIVAELDKINEVIDLKKAQLKDLDLLAQSIFYEMFGDPIENPRGWEVKKLGEVSTEKLSYGSGASATPYDGTVRYIRITDIDDNGDLKDEAVSPNVYDAKYELADGDILFARSGATVGKTFLYHKELGKCIYAGYLIKMVPDKEVVTPLYVYYFTKTKYYKDFISLSQNAVAQPNINAKQYGGLLICIPPLSLQQSFAEKIEAIESQKSAIKQSMAEVETLLASRMDYYFN